MCVSVCVCECVSVRVSVCVLRPSNGPGRQRVHDQCRPSPSSTLRTIRRIEVRSFRAIFVSLILPIQQINRRYLPFNKTHCLFPYSSYFLLFVLYFSPIFLISYSLYYLLILYFLFLTLCIIFFSYISYFLDYLVDLSVPSRCLDRVR